MFLMNYTRPDIVYALSKLSKYTHNPNREHCVTLIRLLKYLKGTINWGMHYQRTPYVLEGFCDANWVSDNDEIQSTSGYVFTLAGEAISWKSSKQTCIAKSTIMEYEFIALELTGQEVEWIRSLLADISLWGKPAPSVSMRCDSCSNWGSE
ncbi:secreted RxLR effector protein 161-like [Beta vulgaris subsp. vulgaris]|uniref:secreted RxLR effector protein 161-like n=1 Tax=Beta vulgaris subsp. vulgaris TaxID=3555 RepID=UPI0020375181|nr:secreted RxLR effector protein 161-like [Beta vulgaris subsp. vulgaris]